MGIWSKRGHRRGERRSNAVYSPTGWHKVGHLSLHSPDLLQWTLGPSPSFGDTFGISTYETQRKTRWIGCWNFTPMVRLPAGISLSPVSTSTCYRSCTGVSLRNRRGQPSHTSMETTVFNSRGPGFPRSTSRVLELSRPQTRYMVIL